MKNRKRKTRKLAKKSGTTNETQSEGEKNGRKRLR